MKTIYSLDKREKGRERASKWYYAHKEIPEVLSKWKENLLNWRKENPAKYLFQGTKNRARKYNLEHNIKMEDIVIPEVCPVFGTPFEYGSNYAASVDRIDPAKGYIKDNIQIISRKANAMKQNASEKELKDFANWVIKTYSNS